MPGAGAPRHSGNFDIWACDRGAVRVVIGEDLFLLRDGLVRLLDAAAEPPDLASLAALTGFADQPHLTRECAALSGLTPAALARTRRPAAG